MTVRDLSFQRFVLILDVLYTVGAIQLEEGLLVKRGAHASAP